MGGNSSSITLSFVRVVLMERILVKETEEVLLSVLQSMILIHMCRQVWSPGVLDVEKMVHQECMLLSARLCVGLTMPCHVIMEPILEITAPSMDTLAMFVKLGWTVRYQILRGREMELGNMAGSLRDRFKDSHNEQ